MYMQKLLEPTVKDATSSANFSRLREKRIPISRDLRFELYARTYSRCSCLGYTNYLHAGTNFSCSKNLAVEQKEAREPTNHDVLNVSRKKVEKERRVRVKHRVDHEGSIYIVAIYEREIVSNRFPPRRK